MLFVRRGFRLDIRSTGSPAAGSISNFLENKIDFIKPKKVQIWHSLPLHLITSNHRTYRYTGTVLELLFQVRYQYNCTIIKNLNVGYCAGRRAEPAGQPVCRGPGPAALPARRCPPLTLGDGVSDRFVRPGGSTTRGTAGCAGEDSNQRPSQSMLASQARRMCLQSGVFS